MNRIKKQIADIQTELEEETDNPDLWMEHGTGHHLLGEYRQAIKSYRRSLKLREDSPVCHFNIANSFLELEKFGMAIRHYLKATELKPDHAPSLNNLADAYDQSGQPEKALEIFQTLVRLNPDDPLSHFNLGNFHLRSSRHMDAARCYEKALSADDSFTDAYYNIAWILKQVDAVEEALSYARSGLAADPDHNDLKKLAESLKDAG
ncbi:MAG: tetratricopeptide repeat protein [Balneolaceae bacterium]